MSSTYNPFAELEQQIYAKPTEKELSSNPIKDTGIKLAQGAIDLGDSLVGVADLATGGLANVGLEKVGYDPATAKEILGRNLSGKQRLADQRVAEADGFVDTLGTALQNPRSITGAITQSAPLMLGGMAVTGAAARRIAQKAAAPYGGMSTEAGRKAAEEAIKANTGKLIGTGAAVEGAQVSGLIASEAEREGRDYSDYALPSLGAGVTTALIGKAGGKLAGDAATEIAAKTGGTSGNFITKVGKSGAIEAAEEGLQAPQETVFSNLAMGEEDLLDGVGENAAMGLLAGGGMGLTLGAIQNIPTDPYDALLKKGVNELSGNPPSQPINTTETATEQTVQPAESAEAEPAPELKLNSKQQPFKDEQSALRAAVVAKEKLGADYEPTPYEDGYALKKVDTLSDDAREKAIKSSDRVSKLQKQLNDFEPGLGDNSLQEAIDSGMDEAQSVKYLRDRQKQVKDKVLAEKIGKRKEGAPELIPESLKTKPADEVSGNEQQAQTQATQENAGETPRTPAITETFADDNGLSAGDKLALARDKHKRAMDAGDDASAEYYQSLVDKFVAEVSEPAKPAKPAEPVSGEKSPKLPKDIAKAKPRYNFGNKAFTLNFESDIDRAAYIAAQSRPSKRDADYVQFVADNTGMSEADIRSYGQQVRDSIKAQAKDAEPGQLTIANMRSSNAAAPNISSEAPNIAADPAPAADVSDTVAVDIKQDVENPVISNSGFTPTHELPNGTPVIAVDGEENVWRDESGDEWEDDNASPIKASNKPALDVTANEAATSPQNDLPEPSQAQKEAGNYKVGRAKVAGMDISIENPKGSKRKGVDRDGNEWENELQNHYGYIRGTIGRDKDHVDVFLGDDAETADRAYVIDQVDPDTGKFDEHKVMIGFKSADDAKKAYLANYDKNWKGFNGITDMPMADFKEWVKDPAKTKRPASAVVSKALADKIDDQSTAKVKSEAPEHAQVGVDDRELGEIVAEFNEVAESMRDGEDQIHHLFDKPAKSEIVRLQNKVKVYQKEHGWMTPAEAKKVIAQWKENAAKQGETRQNSDRVVLSLFDLTGKWSQPWEEAGYQVYRFDIQNDPEMGDVNNFSTEFFQDWFGDFDGMDIYAILAACPCTDFASSGSRHFAAKDADGRTVASVKLVQQTLATIEHFRPAIWAVENPVGRIEKLGGLPPWRLSFDPNHIGDPYTKKTLLWGRFNADMPIAPVEPVEGSKMHKQYGGKSLATKNARSVTPEGFSYGFFMANNAIDHPVMAVANKYDRLERQVIADAIEAGMSEKDISEIIDDFYYMELDDQGAENALREAIADRESSTAKPADPREALLQSLKDGMNALADRADKAGDLALAADLRAAYATVRPANSDVVFRDLSKASIDNVLRSKEPLVVKAERLAAKRADQSKADQKSKPVKNQSSKVENADQKPIDNADNQETDLPKFIGKNMDGVSLYEDERGVRYYNSNGARIFEKVRIQPTRDGVKTTPSDRAEGYKTVREIDAEQDAIHKESKPVSPEYEKAQADLDAALGDLGEIFLSANLFSKKAVPTELNAADLMPVLTRVMDAAFRMGYAKFKDNARFVLNTIRDRFGDAAADSIQVDDLQGAYIAMKKGSDSKLDVISVETIDEIMQGDSQDTADTASIESTGSVEENENDAGRNDQQDQAALADISPESSEELEAGGLYEASVSGSGFDADGNGQPDPDRTGRSDSLGGDENPVLHGAAAEAEPLANKPTGRKSDRPNKLTGTNPGNFVITDDLGLGQGTTKQKIDNNLNAIRTLQLIESEGRFPTAAEQQVLAKYVGWGGLATVFDNKKADASDMYGKAQRELKQLLTTEEYRAAISSTRNAHYTAKPIVEAMWQAVEHFGFKGGRVLEPTVGTGNFIGIQPENLAASSQWFASELDSVTGRIAKMLYPESTVLAGTGFQDAAFANGVFDLAIGNPPFGSETIRDKSKARSHLDGMKIHNYVIAKSGLHLRPGGVMSMVVTHRFLDTANPEARDVLAKDFKFLGAIRLPNDAFMQNAGTEVTTDIIFLQKRHAADKSQSDDSWLDVEGAIQGDDGSIRVNKYFEKNPGHILGRSAMDGTMYGGGRKEGGEYTVHSDGRDLRQAIADIINNDWADMAGIMQPTDTDAEVTQVMLSQSDLPVGGMTLTAEGKVIRRDLDDDQGNAVIETVTPESLWKSQAEQLNAIATAFDKVKANDGKAGDDLIESLRDEIKFAYYANGDKKAKPTKAEQAIYDIVDAIESGTASPWKFDAQLDEIKTALKNRLLGRKDYDKLRALLDIRNRTLALINAEFNDADNIEALRADLNKVYDRFVKNYGYISEKQNVNLLAGDIGVEVGLEAEFTAEITASAAKKADIQPVPATASKATILQKRVNFPHKEITSASDAKDGLHISLSERGKVDLGYIAKLTGKSAQDVINDLSSGDNPEIFFDPETGEYEHADAYLSGNVKHKLQVAGENDLPANVKALEAVQPEPKTKESIVPTIRSAWIPKSVFTDFLNDLGLRGEALVVESIGRITSGKMTGELSELGIQFRDDDATVNAIFDAAAAGKTLNIYKKDVNGNSHKDEAATKRVGALVERMAKVFNQWAYSDENRVAAIVDAYNEKMNTHRKREFDGVRYLRTVGASSEIKLRNTQKNAAWRMIQSANTLLDHVVGAGKTYTVVTGVMERRRLGLSKKPMVAVPNHLVVQWASEWYQLYPGAKLLAATPDDFAKEKRRRLFARIATGDYDAIIIGHSSLGMIEAPADDLQMIINEKIDQLQQAMDEAKASGDSERTVKQMGKRIDKLKEKLQELSERNTDQMGIDFATMGIDFLAVDEAHEFKNLQYATAGERVVGMNDPNGSKRALHLYTLVRGVQERKGGVAFATGTPLSNSLVELYTMMSYLATDELKLRNQSHFDAWSGAYTQTSVKLEYTATQKLKPRRVLSGLMNLDSLRQLYEQFADIITMNDLKRLYAHEVAERNKLNNKNERTEFPVPKVKTGGRQLDIGEATESQTIYTDYLVARMQVIESKGGDKEYPKIDNALNVLTDARKMSLDIRTVDPSSERDHNGKVARAADNIVQIYEKWNADKGAQLVFSDMSTPAKTASNDAKKLIKTTIEKIHGKGKVKSKLEALETFGYQEKWAQLMREAEEVLEDLDDTARERLEDYLNGLEDVDGILITADTGFSVYDDLRTLLIEKGIPAHEIAFIHDFNTPEKKRELFGRVNDGKVRVLLGSTPKMGAGTNAQKRLVALHHMDAPWRPSDVEQREGRIIRQGNMLYQRDPDGFEVEIIAYSTKGTSDTVMWQILERKASAIEQFREGGLDRMEEEGADSDQYAEFMASSTGNPVFKLKMEAERRALELQAEIGGMQIAKANAARFLANYESRKEQLETERDAFIDAVVDEASFAGDTGSAEEFETVIAEAMEDYASLYSKYIEKKHAIEEQYEAALASGKSTKDLPNIPTAPSKPTIARKSIQEKSGYARAVYNFLSSSVDIPLGRINKMRIGDVDIIMERSMSLFSKTDFRYTLSMEREGQRIELYSSTMKDPSASDSMLKMLAPKALAERVQAIPTDRQDWLNNLSVRAASEEKRVNMDVDTTAVDEANALADWYRIQVSFAEVKADRERASRPNKYIEQDTRRPLGQFTVDGDTTKYDFDYEGEIYSGTGIAKGGLYDAVRKSDGKPVIVKVSEIKDDSPVVESVTIEPDRAAIEMTAALNDAQSLSSIARPNADVEFAREVLTELSGEDELFRRPVSGRLPLEAILSEVAAATATGEDTRIDELSESGADNRYTFKSETGKNFYVFTKDDEVWIDVSRLSEGDGGQAIYDAVANYAYNNNMVFVGDPAGLSKQAVVRRTANMLSSALRFGTTRHLRPAKEQLEGDKANNIAPLKWSGNDAENVNSLIETFLDNIHRQFPEIKRASYDFNTGQFLNANGMPIDRRAFNDIRDKGYSGRAQAARAGEATIRRAILIQSLVSSESSQRSGLLEKFLNGSRQLVKSGDLDQLFSDGSVSNGLNLPAALKLLNSNKLLARLIKSGKLKVQRDSSGRQGAYRNGVASVFANSNTADTIESTAWHEITHAAMDVAGDNFINQKVKTKLFGDLKRQVDLAKTGKGSELIRRAIDRTEYAGTPDNQYLEEIAAYLVTEYVNDASVAAGSVLAWIKEMVSAIKIAILRHTGLMIGSISASDMKAIASAYASFITKANPTPPRGTRTTDKSTSLASSDPLYSTAMPSIEQIRATIEQSQLKDDLKKPFERLWQGVKSQSLGALTLRQLGEVSARVLPAIINQYIPTKDKMVVEISKWMELGGKIATDRQKLKKADNQLLSDVQHEATLAGVDPAAGYKPKMTEELFEKLKAKKLESLKGSDGKLSEKKFAEIKQLEDALKEEPARKKAYDRILPMYQKLSADARDIYRRERDYHKEMNTERLAVLTARIEGMSMSDASRKDLLNALQEKFESFEVAAPYFPLSRYGEFWVFAEMDGERTFNMFETENERDRFTDQLKKEGYTIIGAGKHLEGMQQLDGVSSAFVTEVDQLVSQLGDSPTVTNIRKEIYDLYLQSLPDLSARKHFIRRKKTKGFDLDQARAFADAVEHGSRDLGRLKYADRLREIITDMEETLKNAESTRVAEDLQSEIDRLADYLENAADLTTPSISARLNAARGKNKELAELWKERLAIRKTMSRADVDREIFRLRQIQKEAERLRGVGNLSFAAYALDEIRKSHTALLNPNTHPVAQALNSFGFFWFLGLTPAAAFVNLTQTAVIAMPLIGARFGYGRANKLLGEATKAFFSKGDEKGFSVLNSNLSYEEREAFKTFYAEGLIDNTLAHDTAGISENGINNGSIRHKLMDAASFMFHHAERMNREVTALAAYRAARDSGMPHEVAIAEASDVVWHGHFDYTSANRARFLRGNVMRVVTQFKQYSQNMIYLYGRLGYQAFKGSDIEKAEARKALTGIIAMQFGLAGAAGLPLAGLFAGVAQLLADVAGDDDEPFLIEAELRAAVTRALSDVLGDDAGRFASHAMSQGIVNALTPLNLSGRISHSDMLVRMSDQELSGRDAAYDTMKALGGVATSYIEMPFVAIEHLRNENYSKAAETLLPKFARDIVKGTRFGIEDARTARGYLFKEMSFTEVSAQMLGFSSSELADQYGQNTARTNLENRLKSRRSQIIDRMVQARKGEGSLAQARREMEEWNSKHPTNKVTMKNIMQSEKGRKRYEESMNDGRFTTKRYQDVADRFDWNN